MGEKIYPERLVKNQGKFIENKETKSIRSKRKMRKRENKVIFVNNEKKLKI